MWEGPPRLPGSPHPHHWPSGAFLPANTTAVVQGDPGGSTECIAHKVLHGHVCRKRARSAPSKAASLGQGRGLRQEPEGATAGSADTAFSEPSEAGAPDECPMPTAACPARAQGQHPRGTEDGGTVAQVTNSISPTLQRNMPVGGGQAARCGLP